MSFMSFMLAVYDVFYVFYASSVNSLLCLNATDQKVYDVINPMYVNFMYHKV